MLKRSAIGAVVLAVLCAPAWSQKQVTCAVMAGPDTGSGLSALVPLLEVALSQDQRVRLIERGKIDEVLKEQQWTAAGLAEQDSIMKAGRLLRADAFILITPEGATQRDSAGAREEGPLNRSLPEQPAPETGLPAPAGGNPQGPAGQLIRIRVVETAHGLRLWEGYEQLAQVDAEAVSTRIAGTVLNILQKVAAPPGAVVPIGIVDIHRVQLSEKYEPLARVLPGLLSARLGKEPRIIMLERESLGTLLREKQLTEGPESAFWNSAILIDGFLSPGEENKIELNLRLRRATESDGSAVRIETDPNAASAAIDRAATEVVEMILHVSSHSWDPAPEAAEFHRQGQLLAGHGRRRTATAMLDAAHALQPQNIQYTASLFKNESVAYRGEVLGEPRPAEAPSYSPTELADLAGVLIRQIGRAYDAAVLTSRDLRDHAWVLGPSSPADYFNSLASTATEQAKLLNRRNRRLWVEMLDRALRDEAKQGSDPYATTLGQVNLAWIWSDDPQERTAYLRKRINEAILPPRLGGIIESVDMRCFLCNQVLFQRGSTIRIAAPTSLFPVDVAEGFGPLWNEYVTELTRVDDPLVRLYALMTQVHIIGRSDHESARIGELSGKAVDALQETLRDFGASIRDTQKKFVYKQMQSCLSRMPERDPNGALGLWEKALTPLIEAKNAHELALWFPYRIPTRGERSFRLIQRMVEVLRADRSDPEVAKTYALLEDRLSQMRPLVKPEPGSSVGSGSSASAQASMRQPSARIRPVETMLTLRSRTHAEIKTNLLLIAWLSDQVPSRYNPQGMIDIAAIDLKSFRLISMQSAKLAGSQIPGISFVDNTAYLAVREVGILQVGGIMKEGRRLVNDYKVVTEADGLPSTLITGLTDDGARLWVAYGGPASESGLGTYDPVAGRWQGILCSTMGGAPPFNAGLPYTIRSLTHVVPNRLFFHMRIAPATYPAQATEHRYDGLWSIDTATHELTYLEIDWGDEIVPCGEKLLLRNVGSLVEFNPATKQAASLLGRVPWLVPWWGGTVRTITAVTCKEAPFISDEVSRKFAFGWASSGSIDLSSAVVHNDTVWAQLGKTQLIAIPRGATEDQIVVRDNDLLDGELVLEFRSTPHGLIAIGEDAVGLIGGGDMGVVKLISTAGVRPPPRR